MRITTQFPHLRKRAQPLLFPLSQFHCHNFQENEVKTFDYRRFKLINKDAKKEQPTMIQELLEPDNILVS